MEAFFSQECRHFRSITAYYRLLASVSVAMLQLVGGRRPPQDIKQCLKMWLVGSRRPPQDIKPCLKMWLVGGRRPPQDLKQCLKMRLVGGRGPPSCKRDLRFSGQIQSNVDLLCFVVILSDSMLFDFVFGGRPKTVPRQKTKTLCPKNASAS